MCVRERALMVWKEMGLGLKEIEEIEELEKLEELEGFARFPCQTEQAALGEHQVFFVLLPQEVKPLDEALRACP